MKIPFVNLEAIHNSIRSEIDLAIGTAISGSQFLKGPAVAQFELAFSEMIGVDHTIAVANGTDALFLSMKALGISPGDEVITPSWSWISTAETITLCGAKPVFADVDPDFYTISEETVLARITPRTKAVIAVHLYGQAAPIDRLQILCKKYNLKLIEDCAQAHLTKINDQAVGSFSDVAACSFYPTKNLGAFGDAGCVMTNSQDLAIKVRRLANHGALQKDDHELEGSNSRMDTLQASILLAKMPHLKSWNLLREKIAHTYNLKLSAVAGVKIPAVRHASLHSWHIYAIQCQNRDELKKFLEERGIQTMIHYPRALTNLPFYRSGQMFPVADNLEKTILSLPVYPGLTESQVLHVCNSIAEFYA
jgi:dTDP-4-amino-4,6-dideoxygalactose transaminase